MTRLILIGLGVIIALNLFDTNLTGLAGIGLFVLIGLAIWNNAYGRALVMSLVGAAFFGDNRTMFILVAAGLVGWLLLGRRRGMVRRVQELHWLRTKATPYERGLVRQIRRGWVDCMYYAGLTAFDRRRPALGWRAYLDGYRRREADRAKAEGDEARSTTPVLLSVVPSNLGLGLIILPGPDQAADDWENACGRLALQWGVSRVRLEDASNGLITLHVIYRDPLDETYPFVVPEPGSITSRSEWLYGVSENGREVRTSPLREGHGMRQGKTRYGKTVASYVEIAHAVACPDVIVAGLDHTGLLLGDFMGPRHAMWQCTDTESIDAHLEKLDELLAEQRRRAAVLRPLRTDKLDDYIGPDLPLLMVYFEEFPGLVEWAKTVDSKKAKAIQSGAAQLVAQGAKYGIRVRFVCQRGDADVFGSGFARNNMGFGQTLGVESVDAVKMLHPKLDADEQKEALEFVPGVCFFKSVDHHDERVRVPFLDGYESYRDAVEGAAWHWISTDEAPEPVRTTAEPESESESDSESERPAFRKPTFGPSATPDEEAS